MMSEKGSSNRSFGLVFTAAFAVVATGPLLRGHPARLWALGPAGVFLLLALVRPQLLAPLNRAWTLFGLLLSKVTTPVVMGIFYYLLLTPWAILLRRFGKDPLQLRWDTKGDSYWITRPPSEKSTNMENQF